MVDALQYCDIVLLGYPIRMPPATILSSGTPNSSNNGWYSASPACSKNLPNKYQGLKSAHIAQHKTSKSDHYHGYDEYLFRANCHDESRRIAQDILLAFIYFCLSRTSIKAHNWHCFAAKCIHSRTRSAIRA